MRQQQHCRWQHTLQTSSSCRSDVKLLRRGSCFTTFLHLFLMDASKQVFLRDTIIVSMALKETGRMSAGRPSLSHCPPSMTARRDSDFRRQSWILLYYPSAEVVHTFGVLYIAYQQPWKLLQALRRHLSCVMNHHRWKDSSCTCIHCITTRNHIGGCSEPGTRGGHYLLGSRSFTSCLSFLISEVKEASFRETTDMAGAPFAMTMLQAILTVGDGR